MSALFSRFRRSSVVVLFSLLLGACVAPALLLSPQGQLMWTLLKPMVGLDPNEMNLLEQPLIKNRMQPLLGEHYDTAVTLLKTADKLQQEGPLFYLVSNHTPLPQLAEKAGFVWNSETNQMAVMLVSGGAPLVFAEQLNNQAAKVVPSWPADLADYADPVKLKQKALQKASNEASAQLGLDNEQQQLATAVLGGAKVKDLAKERISQEKQQLLDTATAPVTAEVNSAKQHISAVKSQVQAATDLKSQSQKALEQAVDIKAQTKAQTEVLTAPVTDVKTQVQNVVSHNVDIKAQTKAQVQTQTRVVSAPTTTAVLAVAEDDLATEMAAEQAELNQQQLLSANALKAAKLQAAKAAVQKAEAEVAAATALLQQANDPATFAAAKQQLDAANKTLEQAKQQQQTLSQP